MASEYNRQRYIKRLAAQGKEPRIKLTDEERKTHNKTWVNNWRKANPERAKAQRIASVAKWENADPEHAKKVKKAARAAWQKANATRVKEINRRSYVKRTYGITLDEYNAMIAAQNGRCAICETTHPGKGGWHLDHCHQTNAIRKILCVNCNRGLGCFKDNITALSRAVIYLQEFQPQMAPPRL